MFELLDTIDQQAVIKVVGVGGGGDGNGFAAVSEWERRQGAVPAAGADHALLALNPPACTSTHYRNTHADANTIL